MRSLHRAAEHPVIFSVAPDPACIVRPNHGSEGVSRINIGSELVGTVRNRRDFRESPWKARGGRGFESFLYVCMRAADCHRSPVIFCALFMSRYGRCSRHGHKEQDRKAAYYAPSYYPGNSEIIWLFQWRQFPAGQPSRRLDSVLHASSLAGHQEVKSRPFHPYLELTNAE